MKKIIYGVIIVLLLLAGVVTATQFLNKTNRQAAQDSTKISTSSPNSQISCSGTPTVEVTEGPYYKEGSPARTTLYDSGVTGTKLTLTGYVLDTNCKPISHTWLDFWQANGDGGYDNVGYTLRGHQYTDENGKYTLITVVPGEYPGRTPHIHVKVKANDNSSPVTTQLFIPGVVTNDMDSIYHRSLLMNVKNDNGEVSATYNFIIRT